MRGPLSLKPRGAPPNGYRLFLRFDRSSRSLSPGLSGMVRAWLAEGDYANPEGEALEARMRELGIQRQ